MRILPYEASELISHTRDWERRQKRARTQQNAIKHGFIVGLLISSLVLVCTWGMFALAGK